MNTTVVICAYTLDRWAAMQRAVESVERQSVAAEVVIVIDHNDDLLELAQATWPHHVVVANRFEQGLSGARNTGVFAATGDVVAFLDDDAAGEPGWLAGLLAPFADDGVGLTGGAVRPAWTTAQPRWFPDEFLWVVGCGYRGLPTSTSPIRNPIGASMAVRRAVFEQVGMFRSGVGRIGTTPLGGEETELSIRARARGWIVVYEPSSVVAHEVGEGRCTFRYFRSRCVAEGRSKATITDVSDGGSLDAERSYATRTLPSGVLRQLGRGLSGPDRGSSVGRAAMIVFGLLATAWGYGLGRFGRGRVDAVVETAVMELPPHAHGTRGPVVSGSSPLADPVAPAQGSVR